MNRMPKLRFKEFNIKWEEKKLENIGKIIGGGTPASTVEEYWNGEIQWFTPTEIGKSKYVTKSIRTITELGLNKSSAKLLPKGTILLSSRATIGEKSIAIREVCTNQGFQSILVNKENNNEFIYYLLDTLKGELIKQSSGSTFLEISGKKLGNILSFIPALQEQEKIADFLSSVDKKISITEEKLDLFKDYKKGIMQKIFNQELRFKDSEGNNYPEWEEKKIEDIFKITRGYVLSKTETKDISIKDYIYPVFSSQTLNNGLMGFYNKYLFENCITWTTDGANAGTVKFRKGKFYCTNVCGVLISDIYNNNCIAEILSLEAPKHVSYVGNPKLMNNIMAKIKIIIPSSLEEQEKIANFLSSIDNKIENLATKLEDLKEFKKGLLQQMFV